MARRPNLPDHGPRVYDYKECVSVADAKAICETYGFRNGDLDFHREMNEILSWRDTFRDSEERPANESIKILRAVDTAATSLLTHLDKPGADILLRAHREEQDADPRLRVNHPTVDAIYILNSLEARCGIRRAPNKRLRQDIQNASQRLRDALSKAGHEEIPKLFDYGKFPRGANFPAALDWLIQASAKATKQIEDRTYCTLSDSMPKGKRKPTKNDLRGLLRMFWKLFRLADPKKADKIQWDRKNKKYTGTFYEFSKEVFSIAGIPLSDAYLADLVKKVEATNK